MPVVICSGMHVVVIADCERELLNSLKQIYIPSHFETQLDCPQNK